MKLIIYPDVDIWNYMLEGLKGRDDILLFPLNRYCNRFQQLVRKFSPFMRVPEEWIIGKELRIALRKLSMDDSLIICDYSIRTLLHAIYKSTSQSQTCFLWLWNTIESERLSNKKLCNIKKMGYQIVTFDPKDAFRHNISYYPQFYNFRSSLVESFPSSPSKWDFLFVGQQKDRGTEIEQVSLALRDYKCKFNIVSQSSEFISYLHYMGLVMQSRCIVEIVSSKSPFCTLRPLEALATQRKLLTNNPDILQYSFYHPQNIFILGQDRLSDLSTFLNKPFVQIAKAVLEEYDINSWVDSFRSSYEQQL